VIVFNQATLSYTTSSWYTATSLGLANGVGTGVVVWQTPLLSGAYVWTVVAKSFVGATYGNFISFSIGAPGTPTRISPRGAILTNVPTFSFGAVAGATEYQVILFAAGSGLYSTSVWFSASSAGVPAGTGTGSYTWSSPLNDGTYAWTIVARAGGLSGTFGSFVYFVVGAPANPTSIAPNGLITTNIPTFTFTAVSGATDYQIFLYNSTTSVSTYSQWYSAAAAGVPGGAGTGTITVGIPLASGPYGWTVIARNAAGTGNYKSFRNFTIP